MRNDIGTAASVAIHLVLITVAAYITTAKAMTDQAKTDPFVPLVYVRPLVPVSPTAASHRSAPSRSAGNPTHRLAPVSLAINPNIPAMNIELPVARRDDFGDGSRGVFTDAPASVGSPEPVDAYDAKEVDNPASALSGRVPMYPPGLRAAGIEGRVVAQFVVGSHGRATPESIRILSSSNDLFSEAVRRSILETRFAPARLRGKPVSQMVQQLFVFRLDR